MNLNEILKSQNEFFLTGQTLDVDFRILALKSLMNSISHNIGEIKVAFEKDLNKCFFDVLTTELGMVFHEIKYMKSHLKKLTRKKFVKTSLLNFKAKAFTINEPYGNSLIIAPWNYPLQLSLLPLVGAIAGGNTVILKPSSSSPNVSAVIKKILSVFPEHYIAVAEGSREELKDLFDLKFNFVFFTGGKDAGRSLLEKTSKNLIPCTLELGGKSPCVVDEDADIRLASKRIVWGKFLNAGQTCVAPDYILVHESKKQEFLNNCVEWVKKFYYCDGKLSKNFTNIISERQVERISKLIDKEKIAFGGNVNGKTIEPTILQNVSFDDPVMKEEIFGPIMPIVSFSNISETINKLNTLDKPLAFYFFGEKNKKLLESFRFGGGCQNDTIMHVAESNLPFGGVGESGMGSYHSKRSFETFTHQKSVLLKSRNELSLKFPPYTVKKEKLAKWFFGIK